LVGSDVFADEGVDADRRRSFVGHVSSPIGSVRTSDVARSTAAAPRRASCVAIPRIAA
jgi:hypothetical protein